MQTAVELCFVKSWRYLKPTCHTLAVLRGHSRHPCGWASTGEWRTYTVPGEWW